MAALASRLGLSARTCLHHRAPRLLSGRWQATSLHCFSSRAAALSTSDVQHPANNVARGKGSNRKPSAKVQGPDSVQSKSSPRHTGHSVELKSADGKVLPVSSIWLRDACQCSACVDPSSRQKTFATVDIPSDITGEVSRQDADSVTFVWKNDIPNTPEGHSTTLSTALLSRMGVYATPQRTHVHRHAWTASEFSTQCHDIPYERYMEDEDGLRQALVQLEQYGLLFITGVPEHESSVTRIAERIGPLKNTFYGLTWDVRSVPEAKNIAYTSGDLGFHMDLMYHYVPPALQLLHCMRSSAKGGVSRFVDMYQALRTLLHRDRDSFIDLAGRRVGYHYDHPTQYYHMARRVVNLAELSPRIGSATNEEIEERLATIAKFAWAPMFQAPLTETRSSNVTSKGRTITAWHAAAQKLNSILHDHSNVHERLMKPGECVIFANQRTLHARTAFEVNDAGKERWFRGAYIDADAWKSKRTVTLSDNQVFTI